MFGKIYICVSKNNLFVVGRIFIKSWQGKDIGQNGARNAMVGARDGARQDGQGVEELGRQISGKTGILHTHLDADGAPLGGIEVSNLANQVAQDVT